MLKNPPKDYANPSERIDELASLVSQLPFANYSLLRALTAHLILIVQNSVLALMLSFHDLAPSGFIASGA